MPTATAKKYNFRKDVLYFFSTLSVIILLVLAGLNIKQYLNKEKVLGASIDTIALEGEKNYWEKIANENPTYRDAYLKLARIEAELGNKSKANEYIDKAREIDPNSSKIREVARLLGVCFFISCVCLLT